MKVRLNHIGKRYNRQWIFRNLNYDFESGSTTALIGNNGSGKSTLLQIIYQFQTLSSGEILYEQNGQVIQEEDLVGKIAFAAPYLELPGDYSLLEMLRFHFHLLPLRAGCSFNSILDSCGLSGQENKLIRQFSSGMQQRLKLALALYSETSLLLLDEPCSNLDEQGINWYRTQMQNRDMERTCIIASNQNFEYDFGASLLSVADFKPIAS